MHSSSYEIFRLLLVEARERAQMTQVEVADHLGKPQSFVSKYERGERRLDFTEFLEIATVLSIDLIDFIKRYKAGITKGQKIKSPQ